MKKLLWMCLFSIGLYHLYGQTVVVITDGDVGNGVTNWTSDHEYHLDGYVFVESGGILNIEAGTVIKGLATPSTGDAASALIVTRGAQIFASGERDAPIIMTAELDDLDDKTDLTAGDKGLWGGLIVLGDAQVGVDGGISNVEGIPSTEGRAEYGGENNEDNSGELFYVSIRHGGAKLEANNEINGLTLAGVGSATRIEFIEIYANLDDGIEWFGGTVDVKNAVVSFCGDDSYDYDQSWDGRGQFWFSLQDEFSNRAGEWDGSEASDLTPKASPVISNVTFIGGGPVSMNDDDNDALRIRDDAAAYVWNSIMVDFAAQAIVLDNDSEQDSYQRFMQGDITFVSNIFFTFGAGSDFASIVTTNGGDDNALISHLEDNNSTIEDPVIGGISRTNDGGLDPRIDNGSPALGGATLIDDDYFDPVPYRGAFGNSDNWADGWTALSDDGYFGDLVTPADPSLVTLKDDDVNAGDSVRLTADNTYILDGYVFVEEGAVLTIDPGTLIQGAASPTTGDQSSALIISRGGMIMANGTANAPIIMTAEFDDLDNPDDLNNGDKGLWGGLIILGDAVVGVDGGVSNVEGIPSTEGRAEYGGSNNDDNSGTLRYVSIRHGGAKLEANNEINGLTLAGVGSMTTIEYVEVYANLDDGIEWFGGTVDVKNAVVSFCGDDSYDYDQSWDGRGQFWVSIQNELSNRAGEWDGSEASDLLPKVSPNISNMTFIGAGPTSSNDDGNDALRIRDDAACHVSNSIFIGFAGSAIILDNDSEQDSYQRFTQGDITFTNNVFFDMGAGSTLADIVSTGAGGDDNALVTHLQDNGSAIDDPGIAGISRTNDEGLDLRINGSGAAYGRGTPLDDDWFQDVDYIGAFNSTDNWADNWTALSDNGYFGDLVSAVDDPSLSEVDEAMQIYPNPVQSSLMITFELTSQEELALNVYDMTGRIVMSPVAATNFPTGENTVQSDIRTLAPGTYLVALESADGIIARRVIVKN